MHNVKRLIVGNNCNCSKKTIYLVFDFPLEVKHLDVFIAQGFTINKSYAMRGMLYISKDGLVAIGTFGANRLEVRASNNEPAILSLEGIIQDIH